MFYDFAGVYKTGATWYEDSFVTGSQFLDGICVIIVFANN